MKKHFSRPTFSRKTKLIILIVLLFVISVGVASYLFAQNVEKDARKSLVADSDKVSSLTSALNLKLADTAISGSDKISLIKNYTADLTTVANQLCNQQKGHIYSSLISTLDRCESATAKLREAIATSSKINDYLVSEAALASLIPKEQANSTFSQSYETWNGALTAIEAIDTPNELQDQKTALVKAITDYRDAWKALVDADSAKNETAFTSAQELLLKNHQILIDSAQNTAIPLNEMTTKLSAQLHAYFEESKAP